MHTVCRDALFGNDSWAEKNNTDIFLFQHLHYAFVFNEPRPGLQSVGQSILLNQLLFSPCVRVDPKLESHER